MTCESYVCNVTPCLKTCVCEWLCRFWSFGEGGSAGEELCKRWKRLRIGEKEKVTKGERKKKKKGEREEKEEEGEREEGWKSSWAAVGVERTDQMTVNQDDKERDQTRCGGGSPKERKCVREKDVERKRKMEREKRKMKEDKEGKQAI